MLPKESRRSQNEPPLPLADERGFYFCSFLLSRKENNTTNSEPNAVNTSTAPSTTTMISKTVICVTSTLRCSRLQSVHIVLPLFSILLNRVFRTKKTYQQTFLCSSIGLNIFVSYCSKSSHFDPVPASLPTFSLSNISWILSTSILTLR